ncbi:hypothetical protein T10_7277 [Trichinella papuae]|uniref:Uncharacterized protein n=1 Tax=Trichinella papuae TaxID=268474 RepID=A0A0V1MWY9_9BILA|nr:hypothetical protein T10_7277 [Trichinella papuae]
MYLFQKTDALWDVGRTVEVTTLSKEQLILNAADLAVVILTDVCKKLLILFSKNEDHDHDDNDDDDDDDDDDDEVENVIIHHHTDDSN